MKRAECPSSLPLISASRVGGCCPCCFESAPIEMHASGELFGLRYLSTSRPALGQLWLSVDTLHSERTWS